MVQIKSDHKFSKIPDSLIYEMDEGKPIYYRGYQDVLNKTKTAEQIMGSSILQSLLIFLIQKKLIALLDNNFLILPSELGFKFAKKSWRNLDLAIYDKRNLPNLSVLFVDKYIEIAPELVIEVDTKAALDDLPDPSSYFQRKTDQLLNHGVKKVIWIYTASQKIMIAKQNKPWSIDEWTKDLEVFKDIQINIEQLLKEV